jgi:hypothetical protein
MQSAPHPIDKNIHELVDLKPLDGKATPYTRIHFGTYQISEPTMTASHVGSDYGLTLARFTAYRPPGKQGNVNV